MARGKHPPAQCRENDETQTTIGASVPSSRGEKTQWMTRELQESSDTCISTECSSNDLGSLHVSLNYSMISLASNNHDEHAGIYLNHEPVDLGRPSPTSSPDDLEYDFGFVPRSEKFESENDQLQAPVNLRRQSSVDLYDWLEYSEAEPDRNILDVRRPVYLNVSNNIPGFCAQRTPISPTIVPTFDFPVQNDRNSKDKIWDGDSFLANSLTNFQTLVEDNSGSIGNINNILTCCQQTKQSTHFIQGSLCNDDHYQDLKQFMDLHHLKRLHPAASQQTFGFHPQKLHDITKHTENETKVKLYCTKTTGNLYQRLQNSSHYESIGTGFHIGKGYVLTAYHVLKQIINIDDECNVLGEQLLESKSCIKFSGMQYKIEGCVYACCKDLDYALIKLLMDDDPTCLPAFTMADLNFQEHEEEMVHIAGYQRDHTKTGVLVVDSTAVKLPPPSLDKIGQWDKIYKERYMDYTGEEDTKFPVHTLNNKGNVFLLTKLVHCASGGVGMTLTSDDIPKVGFMYTSGHPCTYFQLDERARHVRNNILPCMTIQRGISIRAISEDIKSTSKDLWDKLTFFHP